MLTLFHGAHTRFALHVGLCLTPDRGSAEQYADGSDIVVEVVLDLAGLTVVEVEGYDWDLDDAPGDDLSRLADWGVPPGTDVIRFADADQTGTEHDTYRLLTERALAACSVD